jgi:hypothetical protein
MKHRGAGRCRAPASDADTLPDAGSKGGGSRASLGEDASFAGAGTVIVVVTAVTRSYASTTYGHGHRRPRDQSAFNDQATIAVTLISMRMVGSPSASTPSCVQIGARSGM